MTDRERIIDAGRLVLVHDLEIIHKLLDAGDRKVVRMIIAASAVHMMHREAIDEDQLYAIGSMVENITSLVGDAPVCRELPPLVAN